MFEQNQPEFKGAIRVVRSPRDVTEGVTCFDVSRRVYTKRKTMAEKVFSEKLGRSARQGEFVSAPVDKAMSHEAFHESALKLVECNINTIWNNI